MRLTHFAGLGIAMAALSFSVACGDQAPENTSAAQKIEAGAEAAAQAMEDASDAAKKEVAAAVKTVEDNVERSAKIMKDTYDAERKAGTNAVQAAGDAYSAVDREPQEEEAAKKASAVADPH